MQVERIVNHLADRARTEAARLDAPRDQRPDPAASTPAPPRRRGSVLARRTREMLRARGTR